MKATAKDIDFYSLEISQALIILQMIIKNAEKKLSSVEDDAFTLDDMILECALVRMQVATESLSSAMRVLKQINKTVKYEGHQPYEGNM